MSIQAYGAHTEDVDVAGPSNGVGIVIDNGPHHFEMEVFKKGVEWFYWNRDADNTDGWWVGESLEPYDHSKMLKAFLETVVVLEATPVQ